MAKVRAILLALCCTGPLISFEQLPAKYQIFYGNPTADIKVIEYFSLACPKCLELYRKDFARLQEKYIETDAVFWVFHPDPADLLTLQAMVCLEKLSDKQKRAFWEVLLQNLEDPSEGPIIMKAAMEALGKPIPELDRLDFLEKQEAFKHTKKFLKQPDVITELPTVQINEKLYDDFPNRKFLEKTFQSLKRRSA